MIMVVGMDIDDTITRHPPFFSFLARALLAAGHEVIIITFREDPEATKALLEEWNINYTRLITSSIEACFEHGVNEWKAAVCRENRVEIFFEDDPEVIRHVDESTVCLMPVNHDK